MFSLRILKTGFGCFQVVRMWNYFHIFMSTMFNAVLLCASTDPKFFSAELQSVKSSGGYGNAAAVDGIEPCPSWQVIIISTPKGSPIHSSMTYVRNIMVVRALTDVSPRQWVIKSDCTVSWGVHIIFTNKARNALPEDWFSIWCKKFMESTLAVVSRHRLSLCVL